MITNISRVLKIKGPLPLAAMHLVFVVSAATGCGAKRPSVSSFDTVEALLHEVVIANAQTDIERQRRLLERAISLGGPPELRSRARIRLALVHWKYYRDFLTARRLYLEAAENEEEGVEALLGLAAMERMRGNRGPS